VDDYLQRFWPSRIFRILIAGTCVAIILLAIHEAREILAPFFLALMIALSVTPVMRWQLQKRVPAWLAFILTVLVVVVVLLVLIGFIGVSIAQLAAQLPQYEDQVASLKQSALDALGRAGVDSTQLSGLQIFDPARIVSLVSDLLAGILDAVSNSLLLVLTVAFMLADAFGFAGKMERATARSGSIMARFNVMNRDIRQYLKVTALLGLIVAAIDTVVLYLMGVQFALLWGVISFLFCFIPTVGFILSMVPPTIMALLQFGVGRALLVILLYLLVNTVSDQVIKPKMQAKALDLSPLTVFLSLILWAWVLGPLGSLLALPMTVWVKKVLLEPGQDSLWAAIIISDKGELPELPPDDAPLPVARAALTAESAEA